ncbi:MAG: cell division protein FtsA [Armatimonadota bacterium]|nr:cell division protein FtsA [Armatimonadota bacterium]MCX7777568.1 cell division protein FtsA [Armatimonadota bacterium]MDW8025577.1 cell division protein FtsA [Armatimonadota bacterium]
MGESILCAIDVGTTKICTLMGQAHEDGSLSMLGYSVVPSRGLRKGLIVDMEATTSAITESLQRAERMAGVRVNRVVVGITGHHIRSFNCRSTISIHGEDDIITEEHVHRLLNEARVLVTVPEDYELLHVIQRQFILDGLSGVRNPVGMHGRKLAADVHFVFARTSFMRNLVECLHRSGIEHVELVLEPIAAAEAVLTETEKQLGVALIDIGGGTTDIAIFIGGSIAYSRALPIGGNQVTQDLSIGLRTSFQEAEVLKLRHGCALQSKLEKDEVVEVKDVGSNTTRLLPKRVLAQIIEPRMRELFEIAHAAILESGFAESIASGVVLTGGGSLLKHTDELVKEVMDLPVRIGSPKVPIEISEPLKSPAYATSIGLLLHAAKLAGEQIGEFREGSLWQRLSGAFRSFFQKLKSAFGR